MYDNDRNNDDKKKNILFLYTYNYIVGSKNLTFQS